MPFIDTSLKLDDFSVGESRCIQIGETQIGLFREANGLFALDNFCPHRGAPLHEGFVTNGYVSCPWHQWQFQLSDGLCLNIPKARVATFAVEVRDGAIWVNVDHPEKTTS